MDIKVSLDGNKRVSCQVGSHRIQTDQPVKAGGEGSAPAPYDLFLASIANCAGFYVQSYCQNKGIDTRGIDISMQVTRDEKTKKINGFVTLLSLPPEIPESLHPVLKKVAEQCAVKKTIMEGPEFVVRTNLD